MERQTAKTALSQGCKLDLHPKGVGSTDILTSRNMRDNIFINFKTVILRVSERHSQIYHQKRENSSFLTNVAILRLIKLFKVISVGRQ